MRSGLLTLATLFLFSPVSRADDAADAKAIIEKGIKAQGYKLDDKLPAQTWKEKGTFSGGGLKLPYTSDWAFQAPDKYRFVMNGELNGMKITFTVVVTGTKAWESGFGKTQEMTGEKLEHTLHQMYQLQVVSLFPLLAEKEFRSTTIAEKPVNEKKAVGVKVAREKRPDVTLYFDKTTGLLAKAEMKVKDEFQMWKEVLEEAYLDGYTDMNGKKVFTKLRIVRDGKTMIESTLSDQKMSEKLDAKLFEKP